MRPQTDPTTDRPAAPKSALALALASGRLPEFLRFEETGSETPADPPAVESKPPADPPSQGEVKLTRAEYDQMIAARAERDQLKSTNAELAAINQAVQQIFHQETEPQARAAAIRAVLAKVPGYTNEKIEAYLEETGLSEAPGREEEPSRAEEISAQALREAQQARVSLLRRELEGGLNEVLDSGTDSGKLVEAVRSSRGKEAAEQLHKTLLEEIQRTAMGALEHRKRTTGRFDDRWVREEVATAAKAVAAKYRTVIGDPDKIGRAPETDAGEDEFLRSTPVPVPKYEKGMDMEKASKQLRDWATDALSRGAAEASRGAGTRV